MDPTPAKDSSLQDLRIHSVHILGLFGRFDHRVPLNTADRVTIIHGPNGVGKSVLLEMLSAALQGRLIELAARPFRELSVTFGDSSSLTIVTSTVGGAQDAEHRASAKFIITHTSASGQIERGTVSALPPNLQVWAQRLERATPWIVRTDAGWLDRRTEEVLSDVELFRQYGDSLRPGKGESSLPEWYATLVARVHVHHIATQRLLRLPSRDPRRAQREVYSRHMEGPRLTLTVTEDAQDLHRQIRETLAQYGSESQRLDQTFPQRLLELNPNEQPKQDDLVNQLAKLELRTAQLQEIGLLDKSRSHPFDTKRVAGLDHTKTGVLALYAEDARRKLDVLQQLADRIKLLIDNVNGKFLHKSIHVSRDKGLAAIDATGDELSLESLSSGEQHELVLLYDLLFRVKPKTLVLIDEPELSLHVVWQKRFLPDLLTIARAVGFDAVVATHSPFIIGDRDDLAVSLSGSADANSS